MEFQIFSACMNHVVYLYSVWCERFPSGPSGNSILKIIPEFIVEAL